MRKIIFFGSFMFVLLSACHHKSIPLGSSTSSGNYNKSETGGASYYADKFVGRSTASGEAYSHTKLTAAHRTLPFGTMVKVTNLSNGKFVVVRINDRGPFAHNRVIDLSKAAAKQIDMLQAGIAKVKIEYRK